MYFLQVETQLIPIEMLPNSNSSRIKGSILHENTTAFDVFAYIILCRMLDNEELKTALLETFHPSVVAFFNNYINNETKATLLLSRSFALANFFEVKTENKAKVMDCTSTVNEMGKQMWLSKNKSYCTCKSFINVPLDQYAFELPQCKKEHPLENSLVFVNGNGQEYVHIADGIMVNDNIFILNAIVKETKRNNKDHFIVVIKRVDSEWYQFDNTASKVNQIARNNSKIAVHMLCYVSGPRDIESSLEPTPNREKISIIRNFHTVRINGTNVTVTNSCWPDSILHILCHLFCRYPNALPILDANDLIMKIMNAYKKDDSESIYKLRVKLLLKSGFKLSYQVPNGMTLDAHSNVDSCLDMILSKKIYSIKETRECKCGATTRYLPTIEIDMKKLISAKYGIKKIHECLVIQKAVDRSTKCPVCKKTSKVKTELSPLVFIDIGSMTTADEIYKLPDLTLADIPGVIHINSNIYQLYGVIEFMPEIVHYTVHCSYKGVFYEYNDLNNDVKRSTREHIEAKILIYGLY